MVLVTPAQEIQIYDKHHLFTMGNEPETYTAGASPVTFEYRGWVIKPAVCYDLRFPVWLRNNNQYHVMICVANWPAARSDAFTTLLKARAIENQCYVIGVNRVGVDGNGLEYSGDSCILGPKGEIIESSLPGAIECKIAELSINKLNDFRVKFPVLNDADRFEIKT
jgi:predicted amidohydrolase